MCRKFKALTPEQRTTVARRKGLCLNCLKPGHFRMRCTSTQKCQKCQKTHHTMLHQHSDDADLAASGDSHDHSRATTPDPTVLSHVSCGRRQGQVLLMTCQIRVIGKNGHTTLARALLDTASSTSFISERLVQQLRLSRERRQIQVTGIGGTAEGPITHSFVSFAVQGTRSRAGRGRETFSGIEGIVLPEITAPIPAHPVTHDPRWKHIEGLRLADPQFGVPGPIDVLLGADVFGRVIRHGRRRGSHSSPAALETSFGWVLAGNVRPERPQ